MLRNLLFNTKFGERLLGLLERKAGLAIVEAGWLADQPAPAVGSKAVQQTGRPTHSSGRGGRVVANADRLAGQAATR